MFILGAQYTTTTTTTTTTSSTTTAIVVVVVLCAAESRSNLSHSRFTQMTSLSGDDSDISACQAEVSLLLSLSLSLLLSACLIFPSSYSLHLIRYFTVSLKMPHYPVITFVLLYYIILHFNFWTRKRVPIGYERCSSSCCCCSCRYQIAQYFQGMFTKNCVF